jgi:hypothetical protein
MCEQLKLLLQFEHHATSESPSGLYNSNPYLSDDTSATHLLPRMLGFFSKSHIIVPVCLTAQKVPTNTDNVVILNWIGWQNTPDHIARNARQPDHLKYQTWIVSTRTKSRDFGGNPVSGHRQIPTDNPRISQSTFLLGLMSDNEKDARYTLENMVGNVIVVMGKGREWGGRGTML